MLRKSVNSKQDYQFTEAPYRMESPQEQPDKLQQLEDENNSLKLKILEYQMKEAVFQNKAVKNFQTNVLVGRKAVDIFLGKKLSDSTKQMFEEIKTASVTTDTLGNVLAHIIARFIRVGAFTVMAALGPLLFVGVQTWLLNRQNSLIMQQNIKIDRQSQLIESQRRNGLIFELGNVLNAITQEKQDQKRERDQWIAENPGKPFPKHQHISKQLIGRIEALSRSFKPYRYLRADNTLSNELSPERGQLLFSLLTSELDEDDMDSIKKASIFKQADLVEAYLYDRNLSNINLKAADMQEADLHSADLSRCYLEQANLSRADLRHADLSGADLVGTNLSLAKLADIKLDDAQVGSKTWFEDLKVMEFPPNDLDAVMSVYRVDEEPHFDVKDGHTYYLIKRKEVQTDSLIRVDSLEKPMLNLEN
ncbi:MAG: pentapeptide repeat-containing protein [Bacteroidia bacterium]|nr:pentapeptide repeat-containing protein [Bacteroidia bacterium]